MRPDLERTLLDIAKQRDLLDTTMTSSINDLDTMWQQITKDRRLKHAQVQHLARRQSMLRAKFRHDYETLGQRLDEVEGELLDAIREGVDGSAR